MTPFACAADRIATIPNVRCATPVRVYVKVNKLAPSAPEVTLRRRSGPLRNLFAAIIKAHCIPNARVGVFDVGLAEILCCRCHVVISMGIII